MVNYDCACPTNCEDLELPAALFNDCPEAFEEELSQICDLLLSIEDPENPGESLYKPTDITDPEAWATAMTETGAGIRRLTGIGSLPKPETNVRTISKLRRKSGAKTYTLTFRIDEMTDENYNLIRKLGCGKHVTGWFATLGGKLYGGDEGFSMTVIESDPVWEEDENAYVYGEIVLEWKSKCAPPRDPWVLAPDYAAEEGEGEGGGGE